MMEDPIGGHPTRAEQLDILTAVLGDHLAEGDAVCDLGIGVGYVAGLLADRCPGLRVTGIDLKEESLARARDHLGPDVELVAADLGEVDALDSVKGPFQAIFTAQTFHDLTDESKRRLISWCAERLAPGGMLLIYDRIRLTEPKLFCAQQTIWRRIEEVHGRAMRSAETFDAYEADLGTTNRPAALADYLSWLDEAGLGAQILHLHGNVALIAGA